MADSRRLSDRLLSTDREAGRRNQIRGPHSALTDFLASNNISAQQIHEDYQRRFQEAEQEAAEEEAQENATAASFEAAEHDGETPEEKKKRKRKEISALNRIKQSKDFAKRK
ncbi:UV-damaged DNA-binding protein rad7, partial [Elasticomyces elasticus]